MERPGNLNQISRSKHREGYKGFPIKHCKTYKRLQYSFCFCFVLFCFLFCFSFLFLFLCLFLFLFLFPFLFLFCFLIISCNKKEIISVQRKDCLAFYLTRLLLFCFCFVLFCFVTYLIPGGVWMSPCHFDMRQNGKNRKVCQICLLTKNILWFSPGMWHDFFLNKLFNIKVSMGSFITTWVVANPSAIHIFESLPYPWRGCLKNKYTLMGCNNSPPPHG